MTGRGKRGRSDSGEDLPHGVCLPDPAVLGRDQALIQPAGDLSQRQATGSVLPNHPDHSLLGLALHQLVIGVLEAERDLARPLVAVAVLGDVESIHGGEHHRVAQIGQVGDLSDREMLAGVERLEVGLAP